MKPEFRAVTVGRLASVYIEALGLASVVARGMASSDPEERRSARDVVERAEKAAQVIETRFQDMKARGELRSFHREFRALRAAAVAAGEPEPSFSAYLRRRKAIAMRALVDELIRRRGGW